MRAQTQDLDSSRIRDAFGMRPETNQDYREQSGIYPIGPSFQGGVLGA